ncbi:hypothetical protein K4F52_006262 [Lecanicillium sp. MT-2017a]|nr:hypothetical protein K4F52_006262 [Lecanicillium sp. MT-2017a]
MMFAARRAVAPIASRSATYTLPSHLARRSFADTTKPAEGKSFSNNSTAQIALAAGVSFAAVYVFFLSKPEKVASAATGDPEKEKQPKNAEEK